MSSPAAPGEFGVAIVGVGNMGGAMAANLLARGWSVTVCDIDAGKTTALAAVGARVPASPAEAAGGAAATIVCVVDAAQCEQVLFGPQGLAAALTAGHVLLLCPTMAPQSVEDFNQRLAPQGVLVLDAPMSGGPARARDGSMSLMLAGPSAALRRCEPLLAALSSQRFVISGRVGDGARTKLVNNLLAGINLVGAAEVLALAQRLGLDGAATLDVIERSSGQSWIGTDRMRRALAGDYAPRAHMTLLEKDTRLAMEMARAAGFDGSLGGSASQVFAQACAGGLRELDDAALLDWLSRHKG